MHPLLLVQLGQSTGVLASKLKFQNGIRKGEME